MALQASPPFKLTILICEDEPLILFEAAEVLRHNGHSVIETMTATDALTHLDRSIDILIADVSLPDMSGVDLAKMARKTAPDVGVIFATAHDDLPELSEISSARMLVKPYGEEDLLRMVHALASTRQK